MTITDKIKEIKKMEDLENNKKKKKLTPELLEQIAKVQGAKRRIY